MDRVIPVVTIMLDRERHLKFTIGAMIRFKEVTGKDLRDPKVSEKIREDMSLEDLRAFIWACLKHEDKILTLEEVGDMIDFNNMREITKTLTQAIVLSAPDKETSDDPPAGRPSG